MKKKIIIHREFEEGVPGKDPFFPLPKTEIKHLKVLYGLCKVCGHYGDDCTGIRDAFSETKKRIETETKEVSVESLTEQNP